MTHPLKKGLSAIWQLIYRAATLGCFGKSQSAHNRITIITNLVGIIGPIGVSFTFVELINIGLVSESIFIYLFFVPLPPLILLLNHHGHYRFARILTMLIFNLGAWNAALFYGKSFNGYYLFFVGLVFAIIAFDNKDKFTKWSLFGITFLGVLAVDLLDHQKLIPLTGFDSSNFPPLILLSDSIILIGLLSLMVHIEKQLAHRHEVALTELNNHLEDRINERTRDATRAKEEAIQASKVKSQFVANTSHELRTPLGAIIGFLELILDGKISEKQKKEYLEIAKRNAQHLALIIDEILDLSRIEAEKLGIEKEPVELSKVINEIKNVMGFKAKEKGLDFIVQTEGAIPDHILTDALRLKQILVNLIGNAIKFTDSGSVRLGIRQITREHDSFLEFDILDTGPGIPRDQIEHLFEPFWQADTSWARRFGGTGLGLSLSKRLSHLLGGDLLYIESNKGRGSLFRLSVKSIPTQSPEKREIQEATQSYSLKGQNILLVDDSPDNQILVSRILSMNGATVDLADNGQAALDKIEGAPDNYDLILMDLQMPVLNGYQATQILRQQKSYTKPIIALTAHAMKDERQRAEDLGFNHYLTKPVNKMELLSTLCSFSKPSLEQSLH